MRVTIKQIASELGISHSTVSRVLNNKENALISEATRDRVVEMATRMGYRPSRFAQGLRGDSTQLVGIFVPEGRDYFFQDVVANMRRIVEANEYEVLPLVSTHDILRSWQRLLRWDLDGIFVFDYMFYVERLREALLHHAGHIPAVVGLFSHETRLKEFVAVTFEEAMVALVDHLYGQRCRRLGYVGPAGSFIPGEERYAVCKARAEGYGMQFEPIGISLEGDLCEAARVRVLSYVAEHPGPSGPDLPDAIFCQNDEIAFGAYRALSELGVDIPNRVCLAGCDDIPYVKYLPVPLTSITLPVKEVCSEAWHILQDRIANPDAAPRHAAYSAKLQLRASTQRATTSG